MSDELDRAYAKLAAEAQAARKQRSADAARIAQNYPVTAAYVEWCLLEAGGDESKVRQALDLECATGGLWRAVTLLRMSKPTPAPTTPPPAFRLAPKPSLLREAAAVLRRALLRALSA